MYFFKCICLYIKILQNLRVGAYVHEKPHCDKKSCERPSQIKVGAYVHEKPHCD